MRIIGRPTSYTPSRARLCALISGYKHQCGGREHCYVEKDLFECHVWASAWASLCTIYLNTFRLYFWLFSRVSYCLRMALGLRQGVPQESYVSQNNYNDGWFTEMSTVNVVYKISEWCWCLKFALSKYFNKSCFWSFLVGFHNNNSFYILEQYIFYNYFKFKQFLLFYFFAYFTLSMNYVFMVFHDSLPEFLWNGI